ncbi:FliH/SctL family protein [Collimonas sp. OK412]|uniref:FliH/SctL family protein n=1 Tax=Collimonas sp. (strain OK412) TaxID=1801619 RepID=UPI0015877421|nr:FliH/SctL family protein [Collimonas sp. OK412]
MSRPHVLSEAPVLARAPESGVQSPKAVATASPAEIQEQAWQEGYQRGLIQGQEEGSRLGREEGFSDGRQEGLAAAEKESLQSVQKAIDAAQAELHKRETQLASLLKDIPARIADCLARAEDDMVALTHASVCRIVGSAAVAPDGVRQIVQQAMEQLRSGGQVVIRLHPADYQLFADAASLLPGREVSCVSDGQVALGGCLIDYPQGTLDARLETQLRQFTDLLLRVRNSAAADTAAEPSLPARQEENPS